MLQDTDLNAAIDAYETNMRDAIDAARQLRLPSPKLAQFRTSSLTDKDIDAILKSIPRVTTVEKNSKARGFLYLFSAADGCSVQRQVVLNAILQAKAHQNAGGTKKNLCAVNERALDGRALYVGRSWDPIARIRGHLRADPGSGTYAIHFAAWANQMDLDVELLVFEFSGISDRTLQVLEDGLWDRLRPLLGRRGEK